MTQVTFSAAQLATMFSADSSLFTVNPTSGAITWLSEPMPSGDDHTGLGFFLNPATNRFEAQPVRQSFGPMAMSPNVISSLPLKVLPTDPAEPWTQLMSAIPTAAPYMRDGMGGYLPNGRWGVAGFQGFAASSAAVGATVFMRVMQGSGKLNTGQPGIHTGNPVVLDATTGKYFCTDPFTGAHLDNRYVVGGGYGTIDVQDKAVSIPFWGTDIQCNTTWGDATEIIVEACATVLGVTALANTGPENIGSRGTFTRWNGQSGVYNNA